METTPTEWTVNLDAARASACIGNGRLELEMELGRSLRLRRLRAPSSGTDWVPRTEVQTGAHPDGPVTHHYPVLKLETGPCVRSALLTVLEVLPLSGPRPAGPQIHMGETHATLGLSRSGDPATLRLRLFPAAPPDIGIESA